MVVTVKSDKWSKNQKKEEIEGGMKMKKEGGDEGDDNKKMNKIKLKNTTIQKDKELCMNLS